MADGISKKRRETDGLLMAIDLLDHALKTHGVSVVWVNGRTAECVSGPTHFSMSFLPGNCRVLVSHAVEVQERERGKGHGRAMLELREAVARECGVTLLLATVLNRNTPEICLLQHHGWVRFTNNPETNCSLWGKTLEYDRV